MKTTLYWTIATNGNDKADYSLTRPDYTEKGKRILENMGVHAVVYSIETTFTPEIIEALLNGKFSHCMLPNYHSAKVIDRIG